jgi:hypothetical protein
MKTTGKMAKPTTVIPTTITPTMAKPTPVKPTTVMAVGNRDSFLTDFEAAMTVETDLKKFVGNWKKVAGGWSPRPADEVRNFDTLYKSPAMLEWLLNHAANLRSEVTSKMSRVDRAASARELEATAEQARLEAAAAAKAGAEAATRAEAKAAAETEARAIEEAEAKAAAEAEAKAIAEAEAKAAAEAEAKAKTEAKAAAEADAKAEAKAAAEAVAKAIAEAEV